MHVTPDKQGWLTDNKVEPGVYFVVDWGYQSRQRYISGPLSCPYTNPIYREFFI